MGLNRPTVLADHGENSVHQRDEILHFQPVGPSRIGGDASGSVRSLAHRKVVRADQVAYRLRRVRSTQLYQPDSTLVVRSTSGISSTTIWAPSPPSRASSVEADFNVLGIRMRGYHDFGVALQDRRLPRVQIPFTWWRRQVANLA